MTEHEVIDLLQQRRLLARIDYNANTVSAWTESLSDLASADAHRALKAILARGDNDISVPKLRAELRDEKRRHAMDEAGAPPPRDSGCHCQKPQPGLIHGSICDMHRRIGLDAIATIRAQRKPR